MAKRNFSSGLVYSTNKDLMKNEERDKDVHIAPGQQHLLVKLDKKQRGGKVVTLIEGFEGAGIDDLGKQLKSYCGTGGSVKEGLIIVQGDNREKILQWLHKNNFTKAQKA